jgi:hypothetical protein
MGIWGGIYGSTLRANPTGMVKISPIRFKYYFIIKKIVRIIIKPILIKVKF